MRPAGRGKQLKQAEDRVKKMLPEPLASTSVVDGTRTDAPSGKGTRAAQMRAKAAYWKIQDWSKADIDIASATGWSTATVSIWRKRLNASPSNWQGHRRREQKQLRREQWKTWDWSKQDVALACEHGYSRTYIGIIRANLGQPPSLRKWNHRRKRPPLNLANPEFAGLSGTDIARTSGYPLHEVYRVALEQGVRFGHRFDGWEYVNWRLCNRHLAAIWGLEAITVRQMRYRKNHGPARKCGSEQYRRELEAEKAKAKSLRLAPQENGALTSLASAAVEYQHL